MTSPPTTLISILPIPLRVGIKILSPNGICLISELYTFSFTLIVSSDLIRFFNSFRILLVSVSPLPPTSTENILYNVERVIRVNINISSKADNICHATIALSK